MARHKRKVDPDSVFGRADTVVITGKSGGFKRTVHSKKELNDFFGFLKTNNISAKNYDYEVVPTSNASRTVDGTKSAVGGVKKLIQRRTHTRLDNDQVIHGGAAAERFGEDLVKPKSSSNKLMEDVRSKKDKIISNTSNEDLIEIARRKNSKRYIELLETNDLAEHSTNAEKADVIRDYIRSRDLKKQGDTPTGYAGAIVWDAGKDSGDITPETRRGNEAYNTLDKVFKKNRSSTQDFMKAQKKEIRKTTGAKGTSSRKVFNRFRQDKGLRTEYEAMNYLKTEKGKEDMLSTINVQVRKGQITQTTARSIQNKFGLGGGPITKKELETPAYRNDRKQKVELGKVLGYKSSAPQRTAVKLMHKKMSQNPEAYKALQKGSDDDVRDMMPKHVTYNELRSVEGKDVNAGVIRKLNGAGVEVSGLPPDLESKVSGEFYAKPGGGSGRRPSTGGSRSIRSPGGRTQYAKGGSLLGSEEIQYVGGRPVLRKKKGRIAMGLSGAGGKIKSRVTPKKKDRAKIYRDLKARTHGDNDDLRYLTDEEIKYAAGASYPKRKAIIARGRHMYADPAYRAKQNAKKEERRGIYEAKLKRSLKMSERRSKAAQSPWWKAWYTISHNMWVLIAVVVALSLLFLPIGMFHVIGWAIAVGLVSLVMYVIWVFMELWWLIAQALVALMNLIAQGIIGVLNYIGNAVAGALGQTFTPFEHILVMNMNIVDRGPNGERIILGITWGQFNLVPPDFLKLNEFMPRTFDTDVLIVKIWPALRDFFNWYTSPIATRYTEWIATAEWYVIGATLGIPIALIIIGIIVASLYIRRKMI